MSLYNFNRDSQTDEFGVSHKDFSLRDEIEYNFRRAKEKERQQSLMPSAYKNDFLGRMAAKQRVERRQNMTPTTPDYTQPASLKFDGKNLAWYENNRPVKYWQAMSGQPDYQSAKYTNVRDKGPIPQGNYILRKGTGQEYDNNLIHKLNRRLVRYGNDKNNNSIASWVARGVSLDDWTVAPVSWGHQRVPIQPLKNTDTFGRDSMYVHGGESFGSGGCIDTAKGMKDFYKDYKRYNEDIPLEIKYPKSW